MTFTPVILESPFAPTDRYTNEEAIAYACEAMLDSLRRMEAPYLSHLLYPRVIPDEGHLREFGLQAAQSWINVCTRMVVYTDLGISSGMQQAIRKAERHGLQITYRAIRTASFHSGEESRSL